MIKGVHVMHAACYKKWQFIYYIKMYKKIMSIKPELVFVIVTFVVGFIFVFLTPPMQTFDEQDHFFRAYQISEGNIIPDLVSLKPNISSIGPGGNLPLAVLSFSYDFLYSTRLAKLKDQKINIQKINHDKHRNQKIVPSERGPAHFPNTGSYSPVVYAPQVTGIILSRSLKLSVEQIFYLSRIFNLVAWIIIVFISIRITPFGKWYMLTVAMIPFTVYQAATVSADVLTTGLVFLAVALFLKMITCNNKFDRKLLISSYVVCLLLSLCKPGFWPTSLIFLIIPNMKFLSNKIALSYKTLLIGSCAAASIIWLWLVRFVVPYIGQIYRVGENISPNKQIISILEQPHWYLITIVKQFVDPRWIWSWFQSGTGDMGWGEARLSLYAFIFIAFILLLGVYSATIEKYVTTFSKHKRIYIATLVLLMIGYMATTLYLSFTPVKSRKIDGIQGRYFIPYLIILLPAITGLFYKKFAAKNINNYINFIIVSGVIIMQVISINSVYQRYYGECSNCSKEQSVINSIYI